MKILFINGGEKDGNTSALGETLLNGRIFEQVDLVDYKVYGYGTHFADDQFDEVLAKVNACDTLVIGSPVYWHDLSGTLRCFLDRCYGPVPEGGLANKRCFFLFQGAAPTPEMIERGHYTISRFAALYGMEFMGMATNPTEAKRLAEKL